jgi:gliding motility-associated-like protein
MRKLSVTILLVILVITARADHITGGEMYYTFTGASNGFYNYNVTLKLFMRCNSGRSFNNPSSVSIFDRITNARVMDIQVPLSKQETLDYTNTNTCITNPPLVCYVVGYFNFSISLPGNVNGYLIASQVNFRVAGISNLSSGYGLIGATYTCEIPGTAVTPNAPQNSSAKFSGDDLVIVCADNSFKYSFAAEDPDGDQLRYSFCNAYTGGAAGSPNSNAPISNPPYNSVPYYGSNFTAGSPLGSNVHINPNTGLITGIAPEEGKYVVTVCVEELRNGKPIAMQRKDLQINIASCSIAGATLFPSYSVCRNSKTLTISNLSNSPLINTYNWQFINSAGAIIYNSTDPVVTYTFPDTGSFIIKLFINEGEPCSDSTSTIARVYPGFFPDFNYSGICFNKPTVFIDFSSSVYGKPISWIWDFGDNGSNNNGSFDQNPTYNYLSKGVKHISLIVGDSKGCFDTITKILNIIDKPPIGLAFRDTLICVPDNVQLLASGTGNFSWSPTVNITNANTATPIVAPLATTIYYVSLDEGGCQNSDSIRVRVVDHVSLKAMNDTIICQSDPIHLHLVSDGLQYSWTPAAPLDNPTAPNPLAISSISTVYQVTAHIGSCSTSDKVKVTTIPYPIASAGADTVICFQTSAQLNATITGNSFLWSPATGLSNTHILDPIARPAETIAYTLTVYDSKGCPKPGLDTLWVTVLPVMQPFAGHDTSVVLQQPLHLNATGGIQFSWSPPTGLSATDIANPIGLYYQPTAGILYKVLIYNEAHCIDSAFVTVKVYKTKPSVFVPNAFTPNEDGKNDILKPITAGIDHIEYFNVYNRWGQLVFSSGRSGSNGWDGKIGGKMAEAGGYVWTVKAVDYTGATHFQKGQVLLLR